MQTGIDERELIEKAGRGDAYAFEQLMAAVELYLPEMKPCFVTCRRIEVYDTNESVFR